MTVFLIVLNVLSTLGTVLAAGLAYAAIRSGNKQAKASADALVRERRIDFELDHLERLLEGLDKGPLVSSMPETMRRSLNLLPAPGLERLRAVYLTETNYRTAELRRVQAAPQQVLTDRLNYSLDGEPTYYDLMRADVREAINQRLNARD